jgi:ABC-type sugar transport system substrate-binding protein
LGHVSFCLVDADSDFQQVLLEDAEAAARAESLSLDVFWCGHDLASQLKEIGRRLAAPPRPDALLVLAVRDQGLGHLVRDAARAGIHWVFINRSEDDLDTLRREFPKLMLSCVCADEVDTGRIQGRILAQLLPAGGKILYVEGSRRSLAARDRTAGAMEAIAGKALELVRLEAGWTSQEAEATVHNWLSIALRAQRRFDVVACHTDLIALGAIEALRRVSSELARPDLLKVPIVGCDGTQQRGQAMVADGRLAGTVVLPRAAGPAVKLIAGVLRGEPRPEALVQLRTGEPFVGRST